MKWDRAKLEEYRHRHANMRLRYRYGIEIEFDSWLRLSQRFRAKAQNQRTTERGHIEGWIRLNEQWVCAAFHTRENLIVTFLPCPPMLPIVVAPPPVKQVSKSKWTKVSPEQGRQILESTQRAKAETAWFKQRVYDIKRFLRAGSVEAATLLADALGGLPRNFHPEEDPTRAAEAIERKVLAEAAEHGIPVQVSGLLSAPELIKSWTEGGA